MSGYAYYTRYMTDKAENMAFIRQNQGFLCIITVSGILYSDYLAEHPVVRLNELEKL